MSYLLIKLKSDFAPGSGEGQVGGIDREITRTETGLPVLTARRLKGCLREATQEVLEALPDASTDPETLHLKKIVTKENIKALFGDVGQSTSGWLRLVDAYLEDTLTLEPWLKWLIKLTENNQVFSPQAVLENYTGLRTQTTISRVNGGPLTDTLRSTRVIERGRKFRAEVTLVRPLDEKESRQEALVELLEIACHALRRLGLSRNRGLGEVAVTLNGITELKLTEVQEDKPGTATIGDPTATGKDKSVYELHYRFTLKDEAVLSSTDGDPNLVTSEGTIPGSAIGGAFSTLVIAKLSRDIPAHAQPIFKHWFLQNGLRFLNCTPVVSTYTNRLIPFPLSVMREKNSENELHDLVYYFTNKAAPLEEQPNKFDYLWRPELQLKREEGYTERGSGGVKVVETPRSLNYHTTRFAARFKGRADSADGAVFVYEALAKGQEFESFILGSQEDLTELVRLLGWADKDMKLAMRLGRSRNTQYGGATELQLSQDRPQPSPFARREGGSFSASANPGNKSPYLVVTLTSHLLQRNSLGYPELEFPVTRLAQLLDIPLSELTLVKSFAKRTTIGSYSSVRLLPRPQWQAVASGSVFVFKLGNKTWGDFKKETLIQVEAQSLGIRIGEGYGRFILGYPGDNEKLGKEDFPQADVQKPVGQYPDAFEKLVCALVKKEWMRQTVNNGLTNAQEFAKSTDQRKIPRLKKVSPAQLSRLRAIVEQAQKKEDITKRLSNLKPVSRQQLERVTDDKPRNSLGDLYNHMLAVLAEPPLNEKDEDIRYRHYDFYADKMEEILRVINWNPDSADAEDVQIRFELAKSYLVTLLTQLSKTRRGME